MGYGARRGRRRGRGVFVCAALCIGIFGSVAASAKASDHVTIKQGNPATSFTGTDTSTDATAHNFISIGTAAEENNAITSFTFNGHPCQLYAAQGSAYCSNASVAPGATVSFSGTTTTPTFAFVFCTSDDDGEDNDCQNVTATTGTTTPPAACAPASLQADFVNLDRDMSRVINEANDGKLSGEQLRGAIAGLGSEKRKLINSNFASLLLYGVAANVVITAFDSIDINLKGAEASGNTGLVEVAKKAKQRLEKDFEPCG